MMIIETLKTVQARGDSETQPPDPNSFLVYMF